MVQHRPRLVARRRAAAEFKGLTPHAGDPLSAKRVPHVTAPWNALGSWALQQPLRARGSKVDFAKNEFCLDNIDILGNGSFSW